MRFTRIENVIGTCTEHLEATDGYHTEVESYLVQYLLVLIVSEYESRIKELFGRRCARSVDPRVSAFMNQRGAQLITRFGIGEISGSLRWFGDDYKQHFQNACDGRTRTAWENIYTNRHLVAHDSGVQMTFGDLRAIYEESLLVLDAIVAALELRPDEVADLD